MWKMLEIWLKDAEMRYGTFTDYACVYFRVWKYLLCVRRTIAYLSSTQKSNFVMLQKENFFCFDELNSNVAE